MCTEESQCRNARADRRWSPCFLVSLQAAHPGWRHGRRPPARWYQLIWHEWCECTLYCASSAQHSCSCHGYNGQHATCTQWRPLLLAEAGSGSWCVAHRKTSSLPCRKWQLQGCLPVLLACPGTTFAFLAVGPPGAAARPGLYTRMLYMLCFCCGAPSVQMHEFTCLHVLMH